jgi:penicillin-binding protein 1A
LPIALGAVEVTLAEHTSAFTVFPNDGVRVIPRYITKVTDYEGRVLEENVSPVRDAIDERTARVMTSMLRDVVLHGTAVAASTLKVPVAGKTGTTNDFTDAWFLGFSPSMTCGVWIGFDEKRSLGNKETGARAALPVWIDFMTAAIAKGKPAHEFAPVRQNTIVAKQDVEHRIRAPQLEPSESDARGR